MKREYYKFLYKELSKYEDIKRVSKWQNIDEELALIIYTQRVTRDATKRYYMIKRYVSKLTMEWKNGKSLVEIAHEWRYPPILMSYLILLNGFVQRKVFWEWVREPEKISDLKLRREIKEVVDNDIVYSPRGMEIQRERGIKGEKLLFDWLEKRNIEYEKEKELKHKYKKTPDVLFKKIENINGLNVRWIESKANFGDDVEIQKNYKKQLLPYKELFGSGIVVYWFGYIDGVSLDKEGIYIKDRNFFGTTNVAR